MVKFTKRRWSRKSMRAPRIHYHAGLKSDHIQKTPTPLSPYVYGCVYCGAHARYIVDHEGSSTCTECACIQPASNTLKVNEYNGTNSKIKRHLYSRNVYFLDIVRGIRGERRSQIPDDLYKKLKKACSNITETQWKNNRLALLTKPMRELKLNEYKHSKGWLAFRLSRGIYRPVRIFKRDLDKLSFLFNQVRVVYREIKQWVCPDRKIFMSYQYLFLCLVHLIGKSQYGIDVTPPVNKKSRSTQDRLWRAICCKLGWQWNPLPL